MDYNNLDESQIRTLNEIMYTLKYWREKLREIEDARKPGEDYDYDRARYWDKRMADYMWLVTCSLEDNFPDLAVPDSWYEESHQ